MINEHPAFKSLNIRVLGFRGLGSRDPCYNPYSGGVVINHGSGLSYLLSYHIKGRGVINQGSTLVSFRV